MDQLLGMFKPDNVFTLVFFIVIVGGGLFFSRNWKDILELFREREKNRHDEAVAKRDSGEFTREVLQGLTQAMTAHTEAATTQTAKQMLELQRLVLRLEVLTSVMERVAEKVGNGYTPKDDPNS